MQPYNSVFVNVPDSRGTGHADIGILRALVDDMLGALSLAGSSAEFGPIYLHNIYLTHSHAHDNDLRSSVGGSAGAAQD